MSYNFRENLQTTPFGVLFFLAFLIVVGCVFIPLSYYFFDAHVSLYVAAHATHRMTHFFKDTSLLASWKGIIGFYLLLGALFYALSVIKDSDYYKERFKGFLFGLSLFISSGVVVQIVKRVVGRPRPNMLVDYDIYGIPHFGHIWNNLHSYYDYVSFPSGHAQTAASLGIAIALLFPRFSILVAGYIALIMFSRVMVLAHYPSDVTGGLVVVCCCFFVLRSFYIKYFS